MIGIASIDRNRARRGAALLFAMMIPVVQSTSGEADAREAGASQTLHAGKPGIDGSRRAGGPSLGIQPMTSVDTDGSGYFSDPYPVRLDFAHAARKQVFSGTTKAIMSCDDPLLAKCFSWTPVSIDLGRLRAAIDAAGASLTNFQNLNVFQDDAGRWHAVLAVGIKSPARQAHWTVLVHAHPSVPTGPDVVPKTWSADTVLSGSFAQRSDGNYDGKYFEDDGHLYLLYVRNVVPKPALRNEIVIQPMVSPTQLARHAAIPLLSPSSRDGGLGSEFYGHTQAKLVEAPYITRMGGKYALIYSTGAYQHADYKAGVAWSDTLLPTPSGRYRKVFQPDPEGIWGSRGQEVRYLVQSQQVRWPNFTGDKVIGPGVASAASRPWGDWFLYFAGYDPVDRPQGPSGAADPSHRRPFFVRLQSSVPNARSVAQTSDEQLATWLQPASEGALSVDERPPGGPIMPKVPSTR